jgi:8-oxo-dGTP pyrophosphatase MutT (NUDIX family)
MEPEYVIKLKKRFEKSLPGKEAQFRMAPSYREQFKEKEVLYNAGVMLLLYPVKGSLTTVFMKRPKYAGAHSDQISFPGGKYHPNDGSFLNTAFRETKEEFGIPEEKIKIIGSLTPLYIPVSKFKVFPFVGYLEDSPDFKIDPHEVEYLIEIELAYLLQPSIKRIDNLKQDNIPAKIPYFEVNNNKIWGATAMILNEFVEIWNSLENPIY